MPHKQIPLLQDLGVYQNFDTATTQPSYPFYLNGYFENTNNQDQESNSRKNAFVRRPGMGFILVDRSQITAGHYIQGAVTSIDRSKLIFFTNNGTSANRTWFYNGSTLTNKGVAPAAAGNWSFSGPVVFTTLDGITYGANNYYAATDFTKGAVIDANGNWTEITDAVFTGLTKATNFVATDGYLFIGTTNNRLYNCNLNTPGTWTATNFLNVADSPGNLLWLSRIRNYIIAFKDYSIEFYEDVGNPSPGSPLEPRKQFNRQIGCINRSTIQEVSDGIIFAGSSINKTSKIYKIDKTTFQIKEISDRYIQQCLSRGFDSTYSCDYIASGAGARFGQSQVGNIAAKEFYAISLPDPNGSQPFQFFYDNDLGVWHPWATSITSSGVMDTTGFNGSQAQIFSKVSGADTVFADNSTVDGTHGARFMLMNAKFASTLQNDLAVDGVTANAYPVVWASDDMDFGTRERKQMPSFEVLYDMDSSQVPDPTGSTYFLTLYYRDSGFNNNVGYISTRTIPLDIGGSVRARITRLTSFRHRNFVLLYNQTAPLRIWGIEVSVKTTEPKD